MYYLLFTLFLCLIFYFIPRIGFIKKTGLSNDTIRGLFLIKIVVGVFWGVINYKYSKGSSDILNNNFEGMVEYNILVTDPKTFFTDIFYSTYQDYHSFFGSIGSYWNDLENTIIIKFLAIFNLLSRGNYYINSLFYNFFSFFGHIALFRVFITIYPKKKLAVIIGCFLLPSTLLFTSGIGKDNVVFTLLGMLSYAVYFSLNSNFKFRIIFLAVLSFIGILLIRNHVAIALIPALAGMIICYKTRFNPLKIFLTTYILVAITLTFLSYISPALNPVKLIAQKQKDYFQLPVAKSQIPTDSLLPTTKSLIKNFPQAANHGFLRPYIWESIDVFNFLLALELIIYLFIFLLFLMITKKDRDRIPPFILYSIAFSFTIILLSGYIVPNTNSLVRYRSIFLPFLITPLLCNLQLITKGKFHINS